MPRKPGSGGARQGAPGQSYAQRSDMNQNRAPSQPIRTAPAANYGDATRDRNAQRAIPLPAAPPTPLTAPTQNPNEPLTAGMAQGAGAGPEAVQAPPSADPTLATLKGAYGAALAAGFPSDSILRLIAIERAKR